MNNVLLLAPQFYNYWSIIEKGLIKKGVHVNTIIYPSSFYYKLVTCFKGLEWYAFQKKKSFFKKEFSRLCNITIDTVIIIKSSYIPQECLVQLKQTYPNARFVLYLWDELSIDNQEFSNFHLFDRILSFSLHDSKTYGLFYRPMFYNDLIEYDIHKKNIDLFYIASYKKNRFDFLRNIVTQAKKQNIHYKFVLRCSLFLFLKNFRHYKYKSIFDVRGLTYKKMMDMMCQSKCAIEIQHPGQTGLTTRPIEAIPTHTKIITTNKNIIQYSLYNKNNILIVDENNPVIPISWINLPYIELDDNIKYFYSLSCFVNDLLNIMEK